jgi:phosphoglycerol transferase
MAPLLTSLALILIIFVIILFNQFPTILYQHQNGVNIEASVRLPSETELYGLKLIQLLLPISGHRIPEFAEIARYYDSTAPLVNENSIASLGIIGSLGFLLLIGFIFIRNCHMASRWDNDLSILNELSVLNLSAVLFATIGGFSSLTAYFALAQFRCVNRISIFIAFFSIFAILISLNYISKNYISVFMSFSKLNTLIWVIAGLLLLIGIFDQTSDSFVPPYDSIKKEYSSDEQFVYNIASILPENSMIFQLPYAPFPGSPAIYRMADYSHLLRGYLHSKDLRWSYASMKGRSGEIWQSFVAGMSAGEMIRTLSLFGFSGIYLDSYGYEDGGAKLMSNITQILGVTPIISDNKRLYFFDMTGYNQQMMINFSENKKIYVEFGSGWHDIEDWSGVPTRWMQADATINAFSPENRTIVLRFSALSFYRNRTLEVYNGDDLATRIVVPTSFINVSSPIHLAKGANLLRLHMPDGCVRPCDKSELNNPDSRCLSIAVQNLTTT